MSGGWEPAAAGVTHPTPLEVVLLTLPGSSPQEEPTPSSYSNHPTGGNSPGVPTLHCMMCVYMLLYHALKDPAAVQSEVQRAEQCVSAAVTGACSGSKGPGSGSPYGPYTPAAHSSHSPAHSTLPEGSTVLSRLHIPLYDLLRVLFHQGAAVSPPVLILGIECWLLYLQPWKLSDPRATYTPAWEGYVRMNYHYYTTLFLLLLQTLTSSNNPPRGLSYAPGNADYLVKLVSYLDYLLVHLYGATGRGSGKSGGELAALLSTCGRKLEAALFACRTRYSATNGGIINNRNSSSNLNDLSQTPCNNSSGGSGCVSSSDGADSPLSPAALFVLAAHHHSLYPDPLVLQLPTCGVISDIAVTAQVS